jgi:hypothetical protein
MRLRTGLLAVAVLAAATAGCSSPKVTPIPTTGFSESPAPGRSLPAATGKWSGLATKCPDLTSAAARTLGVAGEGQPTADYVDNGPNLIAADCRWGSTDDHGVSVTLRMTIYRAQEPADAQWQVLSAGSTDKIAVGDEAFVGNDGKAVRVIARSNNVVATVRIIPPTASASPARLTDLTKSAAEITGDMLDDLR